MPILNPDEEKRRAETLRQMGEETARGKPVTMKPRLSLGVIVCIVLIVLLFAYIFLFGAFHNMPRGFPFYAPKGDISHAVLHAGDPVDYAPNTEADVEAAMAVALEDFQDTFRGCTLQGVSLYVPPEADGYAPCDLMLAGSFTSGKYRSAALGVAFANEDYDCFWWMDRQEDGSWVVVDHYAEVHWPEDLPETVTPTPEP